MTDRKMIKLVGSSAAVVYELITANGAGAGCQVSAGMRRKLVT
jgi:hypothetical protein